MATKAKESSSVGGKEKKAPSSSLSSTTKKPTKPTEKPTTTNPEKQAASNLRTIKTSRSSSEPQSPKLTKTYAAAAATPITNKPVVNRRRSFDKPIVSTSGAQKQKQPSPSRQQKALVSPGPRERNPSVKSAVGPVKSIIRWQSVLEKTPSLSKTGNSKDGRTQSVLAATKGLKKSVSSSSSSSSSSAATKKVTKDDSKSASPVSEGTEKLCNSVVLEAEAEAEVKEAVNDEVVELESHDDDGVGENVVSEVEDGHDHDENEEKTEEGDHGEEEEDEKVMIPTVSEEQEQEEEEKIVEDHDEKNKAEQEESSNNNTKNESTTEEEEVIEVKEKEEEEREEKGEEDVVVNGSNNKEVKGIEGANEEEEVVKSSSSWEQGEKVVKSRVREEVGRGKQSEAVVMMHGKKEAQVSNGVIEETASKLLQEERRNKVRALAGAFQSVIDFQSKS